MRRIRLLSMTAVLTLVIWASADRLVSEVAFLELQVRPVAAQPDMVVEPDPPVGRFSMQVSGPRRAIETIQGRDPLTVQIPVVEKPLGVSLIPLDRHEIRRELAKRWSEFDRLSVIAIRPGMLSVHVDRIVAREVELLVRKGDLPFDAEPQLQRSTVSAKLRQSVASTVPEGKPLQYDLTLDLQRALSEQPVSKDLKLAIPLDASRFGPDARLSPASVEVMVVVKSDRVTQQIPTVPILIAVNVANLGRPVRIAGRDGVPLGLLTQTITVRGAPADVQKLARWETQAYGLIHFKEDDLAQLNTVKPMIPEFRLPPGIELAADPEPIELQVVPADAAPASKAPAATP